MSVDAEIAPASLDPTRSCDERYTSGRVRSDVSTSTSEMPNCSHRSCMLAALLRFPVTQHIFSRALITSLFYTLHQDATSATTVTRFIRLVTVSQQDKKLC